MPQLTLKVQAVCGECKGGNERLAKLYLELIPKLSAYYGKESAFDKVLRKQRWSSSTRPI